MFDSHRRYGVNTRGSKLSSELVYPEYVELDRLGINIEDPNANAKYVFSEDQRRLLRGENVPNRSDKNKKVLENRDKIPGRIQELIDDLAFLATSSHLTATDWEYEISDKQSSSTEYNYAEKIEELHAEDNNLTEEEILSKALKEGKSVKEIEYESPYESPKEWWLDLIDIYEKSYWLRDDVFLSGSSKVHSEVNFGFEIGSLLKMLCPEEGTDAVEDIIWGIVLGFLGQSRQEVNGREIRLLENLIEKFREKHDIRQRRARKMENQDEDYTALSRHKLVKQGISDAGITPHEVVCREVHHHQATTIEDGDLHRGNAKMVTNRITEVTPLREIDELAQKVKKDIETTRKKGAGGIESSRTVLEGLWILEVVNLRDDQSNEDDQADQSNGNEVTQSDEEVEADEDEDSDESNPTPTSKGIGKEIDERKGPVSRVLNLISTKEDYELRTTEPIVEIKASESDRDEWKFTPYGKMLAHCAFERDDRLDWIYWYAIGPEEISLYERKVITNTLDDLDYIDH